MRFRYCLIFTARDTTNFVSQEFHVLLTACAGQSVQGFLTHYSEGPDVLLERENPAEFFLQKNHSILGFVSTFAFDLKRFYFIPWTSYFQAT